MALELAPHHDCLQLRQFYRSCKDTVGKTHWWIIWKLSEGQQSVADIARHAGVGRQWVYKLKDRYNCQGAKGLGDLRSGNGAKPLLDENKLEALRDALSRPPADEGLWSGPKVARWMGEVLGRPVLPQVGWLYLKKLGWGWKMPRPKHAGSATDLEKAAYKKTRRRSGRIGPKPSRQKSRTVGRR